MGSSSPEDEDGAGLRRCRNACSLDMATGSTREASKAAAWMWHMHGSSATFQTEKEDKHPHHTMKRRSNSCDRKDSRFRQEAASASTSIPASFSKQAASSTSSVPAASALTPSASPTSKPPDSSIWDCGSKLYDTFELVSFSNRLDRSLLGVVPAFEASNHFCHVVQSPLHHSSFVGVLRTFSLPRMLSVHNSSIDETNGRSPITNHAPLVDMQGAVGPPANERKLSVLRRALTTKWTLSKLVKVLKRLTKFRKQIHRFRPHARCDRRVLLVNKDDNGGGSEPRHFWWRGNRDRKGPGRREHMADDEDDDGGLSEHRYRVYEEKVNHEEKSSKHFHHHHHHYHHHFVHHLDQFSQAAKDDNEYKHRQSGNGNGIGPDTEWSAGLPSRTESARLSSDTMSKICADVNWL
ncbi:hypothetical protein GOP47_0018302 [Adiantum capillus-veneris]|uniref:Uncharacterized protein n=1 Tax=Adiantum capillus-veneris TaxID=13818 RepID=A0A9D4UH25_ADICA|nr:hypothetical protein GOP47_0018302 [Adiantum capillus-veneris]